MRHSQHDVDPNAKTNWGIVKHLIPYLLESRYRVLLALGCLVLAKGAILTIPFLLKHLVDALDGAALAELAPAMLLAQDADFVDLDGPLLLARDREPGLVYDGSRVSPPDPGLWG